MLHPTVSFSPKIGQQIEHNANCGLRDNTKDHRNVSFKADLDDDNRFELFLLDEDQKKVEEKAETRTYHPSPTYPKTPETNPTT
jgi:DNA-directed RNA polymerase II subunit RPB11